MGVPVEGVSLGCAGKTVQRDGGIWHMPPLSPTAGSAVGGVMVGGLVGVKRKRDSAPWNYPTGVRV